MTTLLYDDRINRYFKQDWDDGETGSFHTSTRSFITELDSGLLRICSFEILPKI